MATRVSILLVLIACARASWAVCGPGELVVVDWNPRTVTASDNGFPGVRGENFPMEVNGDWTTPVDYRFGTLYMRMEVRHMPVSRDMNWQWCFHQDDGSREICTSRSPMMTGPSDGPEAVITWDSGLRWDVIDWDRPRRMMNLVLRRGNTSTEYLSTFSSLNGGRLWAGEDPDDWFPMEIRFTVVLVRQGVGFSGWEHHLAGGAATLQATWEHDLPAEVLGGADLDLHANVRVLSAAADVAPPIVTADLRRLGGPEAVPLTLETDGSWRLDISPYTVQRPNGRAEVVVWVEQGTQCRRLQHDILILPGQDRLLWSPDGADSWQWMPGPRIAAATPDDGVVNQPAAFTGTPDRLAPWSLRLVAPEVVSPGGYSALHLAFRRGDDVHGNSLDLFIDAAGPDGATGPVPLLAGHGGSLDLAATDWQTIDVPLQPLDLTEPIESIRLVGDLSGTFQLSDVRLVAVEPSVTTAVADEPATPLPRTSSLQPNVPNPFNSGTSLRFSVAQAGAVTLEVYNLAGQRVAAPINDNRGAGSYSVFWDGRDHHGRPLASGVYVSVLRTAGGMESRKLLLLR